MQHKSQENKGGRRSGKEKQGASSEIPTYTDHSLLLPLFFSTRSPLHLDYPCTLEGHTPESQDEHFFPNCSNRCQGPSLLAISIFDLSFLVHDQTLVKLYWTTELTLGTSLKGTECIYSCVRLCHERAENQNQSTKDEHIIRLKLCCFSFQQDCLARIWKFLLAFHNLKAP